MLSYCRLKETDSICSVWNGFLVHLGAVKVHLFALWARGYTRCPPDVLCNLNYYDSVKIRPINKNCFQLLQKWSGLWPTLAFQSLEFGFNSKDYRQPQNQRPLFHHLMKSHQIYLSIQYLSIIYLSIQDLQCQYNIHLYWHCHLSSTDTSLQRAALDPHSPMQSHSWIPRLLLLFFLVHHSAV